VKLLSIADRPGSSGTGYVSVRGLRVSRRWRGRCWSSDGRWGQFLQKFISACMPTRHFNP